MKYFSPSILDGSVTTAKLASFAVTRIKISTSMTSQAGPIGIQGKVIVILSPFTLFPDIEGDNPISATLDVNVISNHQAIPSASVDAPRFDIRNQDTGAIRNYSVAWRHISV